MADEVIIDASEFTRLGDQFLLASRRAVKVAEPILEKGAFNLKKAMTKEFQKHPYFKRVGSAVSYERKGFASHIGFEIGPEIGRGFKGSGSMAGIAVEGGANGGGGTVDVDHLLEPEMAKIEKFITKAIGDLL